VNNIVFITGPAGSGKSTIAHLLAKQFPKCLHIQVDHLRDMMVNGNELPQGQAWNEETTRQFQRARSTATYMAQLYARDDVDVIIDDVCVPAEFVDHYQQLFQDRGVHRVLLLPTREALIERMRKRAGPYDKFLIEFIPWFYSYLDPMSKEGWIVLDTSDWTIEQTVEEVLSQIGAKSG
jgi:adenylate kinase family enzyme